MSLALSSGSRIRPPTGRGSDRRRQGRRLPAGALARDTGRGRAGDGTPPASITIETDDSRKTFEELKSRGVEFVSDVLELPWGYVAQFQDPDGNRLQIREGH